MDCVEFRNDVFRRNRGNCHTYRLWSTDVTGGLPQRPEPLNTFSEELGCDVNIGGRGEAAKSES